MSSRKQQYAEKQARKAQFAVDKELESGGDNFTGADADVRDAAMGKGGKNFVAQSMRVVLTHLSCRVDLSTVVCRAHVSAVMFTAGLLACFFARVLRS